MEEKTSNSANRILTVITIALTLMTLYLGWLSFKNQKFINDLQTQQLVKETIYSEINKALDLIAEGEYLMDELAIKSSNGEIVTEGEQRQSYELIKSGLDILENLKVKNNSTEAIICLIRFYSHKPSFKKKVQELRKELSNLNNNNHE